LTNNSNHEWLICLDLVNWHTLQVDTFTDTFQSCDSQDLTIDERLHRPK